jgi:hypothetical protein
VANLPPISTKPEANFENSFPSVVDTGGKFATGVNDTGGKFATFMIEDFLHLPPVSTTPVANLELRISPRIFEKIRNGPNGVLRGLGETDS